MLARRLKVLERSDEKVKLINGTTLRDLTGIEFIFVGEYYNTCVL